MERSADPCVVGAGVNGFGAVHVPRVHQSALRTQPLDRYIDAGRAEMT